MYDSEICEGVYVWFQDLLSCGIPTGNSCSVRVMKTHVKDAERNLDIGNGQKQSRSTIWGFANLRQDILTPYLVYAYYWIVRELLEVARGSWIYLVPRGALRCFVRGPVVFTLRYILSRDMRRSEVLSDPCAWSLDLYWEISDGKSNMRTCLIGFVCTLNSCRM